MSNIDVQQLIEAGVHFGCRVSRWNPKIAPYIYGRRNLIHIMDLREKNSFIKWALDQGHTVFVLSWVNPDARLAQMGFGVCILLAGHQEVGVIVVRDGAVGAEFERFAIK